MNKVLEYKKVKKSYNTLQVIEDISLYLKEGEVVCLLGPSGSGKTTLFRLAAGLTSPDSGKIFISPEVRVGYVFQEPRLMPWYTVEENLEFVQQNFLTGKRAELLRENLLELTGLMEFRDNYPGQLSGGMKQRVELIRSLAVEPDLLLLDEPFKSVDTRVKLNLRKLILGFREKRGSSIFLITHDPEEAVLVSDRIYVLGETPAQIAGEFRINISRCERNIGDPELGRVINRINDLFLEPVENYEMKIAGLFDMLEMT